MYIYYLVLVNKREIQRSVAHNSGYIARFEKVIGRRNETYKSYDKAYVAATELNSGTKPVKVNGIVGYYMPYYERISK